MSANKQTVQNYIDAYNRLDHEAILSCLTDDVVWDMPGFFHHVGKEAFDAEIEGEGAVGYPTITIGRMTEEDDVVVLEGHVKQGRTDGSMLEARFCDIFEMRDAKIERLTVFIAIMQ